MGVQEVRLDKGGTVSTRDCILFYGKGHENRQMGIVFVRHRIVSAFNRVEFAGDRMLYIYISEMSLV